MNSTRAVLTASVALVASLALAGCIPEEPPESTASPSTTPSSTAELTDRSSEVVDAFRPPESVGETPAKSDSTFAGSTFTIYGVTVTDLSTVLTLTVTGGPSSFSNDANILNWENFPVLVTQESRYFPVLFEKDPGDWAAVNDPHLRLEDGVELSPETILYPTLPADVSEVTLTSQWFEDVTVPVTRLP